MGSRGARLSTPSGHLRAWVGGFAAVALSLTTLTGCTPDVTEHATTGTDVVRAEKIWADPWIAPDNLVAPSTAYGSNGFVTREAGSRTTTYAGGRRAAARRELGAARHEGWALHGVECTPDGILVELTRGSGLETGQLARIQARDDQGRAVVEVTGLVPHHADGSWPDAGQPIRVRDTCLGGGETTFEPFIEQGEPLPGEGAKKSPEEPTGWQREAPDEDESALVEEVESDPWFTSNGAELSDPRLRSGDNSRFGPAARVSVRRTGFTPAEAARATIGSMKNWQLTWVACARGTLTATLRLRVKHGVAVARVQVSPEDQRDVVVDLSLPAVETPQVGQAMSARVLERSRCLDGKTRGASLTIEGQPVAVANHVQPLPDSESD